MRPPRPFCTPSALRPPRRGGHGPVVPAAALVVAGLLLAGGARAERVALLPLEGEGLLTKTRSDLDDELRAALQANDLDLQARAVTEEMVAEAQGAGLGNCALNDDVCIRRVGAIAEVDTVFRATVELVDERMVLRLSRLAVRSATLSQRTASVIQLPALDGGKSLRAAVRRALTGKGEPTVLPFTLAVVPEDADVLVDGKRVVPGTLWLKPGTHALRATAPGHLELTREILVREDGFADGEAIALTPEQVEVPVMRYVGLGLVGVGGLALVVGGVATSLVEISLYDPQPYDQRMARQQFGIGAIVTTAAGAAALVVGGVFAIAGGGE